MSTNEITYDSSKRSYCYRIKSGQYKGNEIRTSDLKSMTMYIEDCLNHEGPIGINPSALYQCVHYDFHLREDYIPKNLIVR